MRSTWSPSRVMLTIALVIANLMASVRQQTRVAGARERRTALLYAMSRELAATRGIEQHGARRRAGTWPKCFECQAVGAAAGCRAASCTIRRDPPLESSLRGADLAIAQWVLDHGRQAGLGTDTLPAAPALYVPLGDERQAAGRAGGAARAIARRVLLPEQRHLLETFAGQIGLALERARLAESAEARASDGRARESAQHAARLDLTRPAHAARGDGGRRQHARRARRDAWMRPRACRWRAPSRPRRARCRSWSPTCST